MTIQLSVAVRNARADAVETVIGTSPLLRLRTGAQPADCAAARTGTVVATLSLPSDWMDAASSGAKAKAGTWQDTSADATGIIAHFEIMDTAGTTCHKQGSVTVTGGGGDLTVDNTSVNAGQAVTITSYGWTEPNA